MIFALQWRHTGRDSVSNHQPHDCLLNRLFRSKSTKTSKLRVTGHCAGNLPGTNEFPAQMASNAENVSIWWRHHGQTSVKCPCYQTDLRTIPSSISVTIRDRVIHICLSKLAHHWSRVWLGACSMPSHRLNQCWFIVNKTLKNIFKWHFCWKCI